MNLFRLDDQNALLDRAPGTASCALPLPSVVDSQVVALLHLVLGQHLPRPVVLDACGVTTIQPVAALLLAAVLQHRAEAGAPVRIVNLPFPLRRRIERHPLAAYTEEERAASPSPL